MFEDRQYQEDAENAVFKYLDKYPLRHPLVALPTGSGKTPVMARIVKRIFKRQPDAKIVVVSHDSEILKQNEKALSTVCEVAVNSASLFRREIGKLTVAGIQSVFRIAEQFREFDYILIDECHTIPMSEDSMYRKFFAGVGEHTRIGLTATPYRLGQGYIVGDGHMFDKIVIDLTFGAKFTRLIKDGYLSKLIINNTSVKLDVEGVHLQGGDFSLKEMSTKFDRMAITNAAINEMVEKGARRKKWLVFAIDIEHADNICDALNSRGINSMVVHSDMEFNKQFVINSYRNDTLRCIVNVGMLTTGFDVPNIDLIGVLRPTQSPGLHVQIIGRGLRVAPGKKDCLVLDYAGNTERLGPINRIRPVVKGKGKKTGQPITKTCEYCDTIVSPMTKICPNCGKEFKFKQTITTSSGDLGVVAESDATWFKVTGVDYDIHFKKNSTPSIVVRYHCGLRFFKEWVCPDHNGYAGAKGKSWLRQRNIVHDMGLRDTVEKLRKITSPKKIRVKTDTKYPEVLGYEF